MPPAHKRLPRPKVTVARLQIDLPGAHFHKKHKHVHPHVNSVHHHPHFMTLRTFFIAAVIVAFVALLIGITVWLVLRSKNTRDEEFWKSRITPGDSDEDPV